MHSRIRYVALAAVGALALVAIACSKETGVSQAELDAAKAQTDAAVAQVAAAKAQAEAEKAKTEAAQVQVSAAQAQATAGAAQAANIEDALAVNRDAVSALTKELEDLRAATGDKDALIVSLESQLSEWETSTSELTADYEKLDAKLAGVVPITITQSGQLQVAPSAAQPTGWDTAESIRGGLKLVATFDSSGADAWDAAANPDVYVTSIGGTAADGKTVLYPGLHIINSYTKKVIASVNYNLGATVSPHTVGASMDGKWFYLEGARSVDGKSEIVVFVINARTLKIDKVLKQQSMYQGTLRTQNLHHVTSFVDSKGNERTALEFGFGSTGGPHFLIDPKDDNRVVKAITMDDTGYPMGHPFLTVDPTNKYLFVSLKMSAWAGVAHDVSGVAKINMETWGVTIIPAVGDHLIGLMTTADGKWLYAVDGENSRVAKIDLSLNQVVGETGANVAGPYGLALTWDEKLLYIVGKGEGQANQGHVLGVIDTTTFRPASSTLLGVNQPIELGGASRTVDHAFLHPDPALNELWVSNMGGPETTVLDLKTNKVIAHISTPDGGNTHSGAFVHYNADWTGKLLADHGGPKAEMVAKRLAAAQAAAAAAATPVPPTPTATPRPS